jgi:hypothetical protein
VAADQVQECLFPVRLGERAEALLERRRGGRGGGGCAPRGRSYEPVQKLGNAGECVAESGQVQANGNQQGLRASEGGIEQLQAVIRREGEHTLALDSGLVGLGELGGASDLIPGPPGEADSREPKGPAMSGQGIEKGIGGGVVGLAGGAQDTRDGGKEDKSSEVEVTGEAMEVESGIDLGSKDAVEAVRLQGGEDGIVEDHGAVEDSGERVVRGNGEEQSSQCIRVCDVASGDGDLSACSAELFYKGLSGGRVRPRAGAEEQVSDAMMFDEVSGQNSAEAARCAGDEDRAVGVELPRDRESNLADMSSLSEEAEGLLSEASIPTGDGQRSEVALLEQVHEVGEHLLDELGLYFSEVEGAVKDAWARASNAVWVAEVGLPHLDEAAAAGEESERGVDKVSGEGVEDDIAALSVSDMEELV